MLENAGRACWSGISPVYLAVITAELCPISTSYGFNGDPRLIRWVDSGFRHGLARHRKRFRSLLFVAWSAWVDCRSDALVQLICTLPLLRWFVDLSRCGSPHLLFNWTRAKHFANRVFPCLRGSERPHVSFGQPKAPKSGVAPAHPSVLPATKLNAAQCATSTFPTTSVHPKGEQSGERDGDLYLSSTVHLPSSEDRADADDFSPGRCHVRSSSLKG